MGPTSPALSTLAVSEKTPRLSLSSTGWRQLSARIDNWPANAISVMIKREEDGSGRPCVFKWSPLDLVLRIYPSSQEEGTETPVTQPQGLASDESGLSAPFSVPSADLIELWPRAEATVYGTIPEKYGPMLRVGGQYETDYQAQDRLVPPGPEITLLASPRFRITAVTPQWWLQRQHRNQKPRRLRLLDPSTRVPGAPILTVTLHADDATITCRNWDIGFSVKTKVAYEGVLGAETAGPIMFHAGALTGYEADLVLEHQEGETWEQVPLGFFCGGAPDGSRSCVFGPGESWIGTLNASDGDPWDIPSDGAQGGVFRLRHRGCVVDWWNWGGPEDLAAVLDSFSAVGKNSVVSPTDLDRRPRLVVPVSDAIELEYKNRDEHIAYT
ncbi:hypothetical protein BJX66DRAFT_325065 [Aspergillus keveii]|uniref:Uncharacterized protein n=1 Tax=Aspergillus keveii TaxID=714993 RepID=A0ABR4G780_9EURO